MPLRVNNGLPITVEPSVTSELLGALTNIAPALPVDGLLGPEPPHARLDVRPARQLKEMWCWAACARMVLRFFGSPLQQCEIAGLQLERRCCDPLVSPECNQGCSVEEIDQAFGFAGLAGQRVNGPLPFEDVVRQINGTPPRPLVAGVAWAGGGGHIVVISGCRVVDNIRFLRVNDPFYGPGDIRYSDLVDSYGRNGTGVWRHTWLDLSKP